MLNLELSGGRLPGLGVIKPIEILGLRAAQLTGASRMPGVSQFVERQLEQERTHAQQARLQALAGELVIIGGNLADYRSRGVRPDQLATRTGRVLFEQGIINERRLVLIRPLITDTSAVDESVQEGAHLLGEAIQSEYGITPLFIPEPQFIKTGGRKSGPLIGPMHNAIDETIIEFRERIAAIHGEMPPRGHSHLAALLVARDSVAGNALPAPISPENMEMGRSALLGTVSNTPQENTWFPDLAA